MMLRSLSIVLLLYALGLNAQAQSPTPTPDEVYDPVGNFFRFREGDLVIVRTPPGDNLRLRAEPDYRAAILVNMADGAVATFLGEIESVLVLNERGTPRYVEYWYKVRLGRPTDPNYTRATEGWALGWRNGISFLVPVPAQMTGTPTPPCDLAPPRRLVVGGQGRVLPDSIARLYAGPSDLSLIVELAGLDVFTVIGEAVCGVADNYAWPVEFENFTGWLLETDSDDQYRYLVTPYDPAGTTTTPVACPGEASQLTVGMMARASSTLDEPLDVRSRPTITGTGLALLYPDETVTIVAGPLCYAPAGTNRTWWSVQNARGVRGWMPEADFRGRVLLPVDSASFTPTPTIGAACILTTLVGVNLRAGAGAEFEIIGSAAAETAVGADGQALAADGSLWWRLVSGEWVAANLTAESKGCADLPVIKPDEVEVPNPTASPTVSHPPVVSATATPTPNAPCVLTVLQGVNLRAIPSTDGERLGSAAAGALLFADAQFAGTDGLRWWRMAQRQPETGLWVREDFVQEIDACNALPVVAD